VDRIWYVNSVPSLKLKIPSSPLTLSFQNENIELACSLTQLQNVRLIAIKNLREAATIYPDVAMVIEDFYQILKAASWQNLEEVKQSFASAETVGNFTVFNIKGNRYRLILSINYQKQIAFFKYFLTHADYDKDKWKNDPYYQQ
jgi:mRNA interferase HigB